MPVVIDAHVHLYPSAQRGAQAKGRSGPPYGTCEELDEALGTLLDGAVIANFLPAKLMRERAGTGEAELWTRQARQNTWALEVAERDGRLRVLVGALPTATEGALVDLESWLARDACCGIKLHPSAGDYRADDPRIIELAAMAGRFDKAVLVHAGPFAAGHRDVGAEEICGLAGQTTCRLVVAHLGGAGVEEAEAIASVRPGIWLDTSAILTSTTPDAATALLDGVLDRIGDERLIYGSDVPFFGFAESLDRLRGILSDRISAERLLSSNAELAYRSSTSFRRPQT